MLKMNSNNLVWKPKSIFWLVVFNKENGDFSISNFRSYAQLWSDNQVTQVFEDTFPTFKVVHIGDGDYHPKTYASLKRTNSKRKVQYLTYFY